MRRERRSVSFEAFDVRFLPHATPALLQFLLVLLIFPSFVFFGIQGYSRFTGGDNATVAKVAGQTITQAEWDSAHARRRSSARGGRCRASTPSCSRRPR